MLAPIEADEDEVRERWFEHPLGSLTYVLTEQLRKVAEESRSMVVVADASGLVLHRVGEERLKERAAEMNLVEGARYSEAADGTNGIGTALAADHPFQVFAFEHFNERHHEWICSGAPVHDPVSGQVIGLIDLSSLWKVAHPGSLELVIAAARTMEQRLLEVRRDQDARLRRRYGDLMTRSTDLLVNRDGYVLAGAEPAPSKPLDIPEGGGEVVLGHGSVAVAASLGQGEAYLLRQVTTRHAKSAPPVKGLERAEERARELATEQAALRQVATLVARESSPDQLFTLVAEQVARIFDVPHVRLVLYEPEGSFVVGGFSDDDDEPFPIGSRWPLDSPGVTATVRQTGRPARVEDYAHLPGEVAAVVRGAGMHSAVACPIVVESRLWGAMVVLSPRDDPLPEDTEARLTDFTQLVATAIANAESRQALAELADEQAALRRVATLVAQEVPQAEVFSAIAEEIGRLLRIEEIRVVRYDDDRAVVVGGWGWANEVFPLGAAVRLDDDSAASRVFRTGRSVRIDDYATVSGPVAESARSTGVRSVVATPISVGGRVWGAITAGVVEAETLPPHAEFRLAQFTELMATAIGNAETRVEVERLAEEQAALRRVAVLVAQQPSPGEVFTAVTEAVGVVLGADLAVLHVFPGDGTATTIAGWSGDGPTLPIGSRFPLDGDSLAARIFESGAPARMHSYDEAWEREATDVARSLGVRSAVGAPILVEGKLWGALMAATRRVEPWAENAETRIAAFTELVATAIANAESREARAALTDEQAALRRVATLVAGAAPPADISSAVSNEVATLFRTEMVVVGKFDGDPASLLVVGVGDGTDEPVVGSRWKLDDALASTAVYRTGLPARFDHDSTIADPDVAGVVERFRPTATVAVPIKVESRLWGAMIVSTRDAPLPTDTEERLQRFTDLIATALANAEARSEVERLAEEQAAQRRVAVLVAQQPSPSEVFTAVTQAVGLLLGADLAALHVFQDDGTGTTIAAWSGDGDPVPPIGSRVALVGDSVAARIFETGAPARLDSYAEAEGEGADLARSLRLRSTVGAPILVEGKLWGALMAATRGVEPWADDAETRIAAFTELVATAIANAESREALAELADEQAALRRVATLVARGAQPNEVFWAVSDEVGRLFGTELASVGRFEADGRELDLVGAGGTHERWELADFLASAEVFRTGRSARVDAAGWESDEGETAERLRSLGIVSTVASPIVVEGELWGAMTVAGTDEPLPPETEERLEKFTEIVATAIANAESREARAVLTEEQAALRRVATLAAQGALPLDLFAAVAEEVGRVLPVGSATMGHFEPDGSVTTVASWSNTEAAFPTGGRWPTEGTNVAWMVLQTARSARIDDFSAATDPIGVAAREAGMKSAVGSPIVVQGHLWGVMTATSNEGPLPSDTESRLASFTELVATAIANAESSAELAASRRRIVAASDDARRRIERDLHDGVQQQLVSLGLELGALQADPAPSGDALREQLAGVTEDVGSVLDALVEIARGIHPAILSQGGLAAALKGLARRSAVPVELHAQIEGPLPDEVEVAAYYVAAETLTNAAKHARASVVHMDVTTNDRTLTLMIRDDGVGGADLGGGSGLVGLQDRVEALGGTIKIDSSRGSGTSVVVTLPIAVEPHEKLENLPGPPELESPTSPA